MMGFGGGGDESQIQSQMDGWELTFFFFLFKSKPQIGLKAAIHNLSGEAGI